MPPLPLPHPPFPAGTTLGAIFSLIYAAQSLCFAHTERSTFFPNADFSLESVTKYLEKFTAPMSETCVHLPTCSLPLNSIAN